MPSTLEPLLRPRSVAVIGASRHRDSIGGAILHNLLDQEFQGPVYPVNPSAAFVQSVASYPSVEAIPGPVDLEHSGAEYKDGFLTVRLPKAKSKEVQVEE